MLFGANAVAMKFSLAGIGPYTNAGLRFSIAAAALVVWARLTHRPLRITAAQLKYMVFLTLVFYVQISFFYTGMSKTSASHGVLIGNLLPFVVMVIAHNFLPDEKIEMRKSLGLVFGFLGVCLLFFDKTAVASASFEGDLLVVLAVLTWGCNAVFIKKIIHDFHPIQITIYPMLLGVPLYFLSGFFFDDGMIANGSAPVILGLLYQVLTASFGFISWNGLIKKYGATPLHSFVFLMPFSGVFFGVLLLNEPLTPALMAAIVLVTSGLIIINRQPSRKTAFS